MTAEEEQQLLKDWEEDEVAEEAELKTFEEKYNSLA